MIDALATGLILGCLAFALVAFGTAIARRAAGTVNFYFALATEVALLAQLVAVVVSLIGGDRPTELGTFLGYLIASVLLLPLAVFWMIAERSRWGAMVLGVGFLATAVMVVRMQDLWTTVGGAGG